MPRHWLTIVRSILRDLRRANTAKPDESQLDLLGITIQQTYDLSGLENICIIEEFLNDDPRKRETDCMVALFRPKMSADFCSKYVSSLLFSWIAEDMSQQIVDSVRIKRLALPPYKRLKLTQDLCRNPILQIPNDIFQRRPSGDDGVISTENEKQTPIHFTGDSEGASIRYSDNLLGALYSVFDGCETSVEAATRKLCRGE
jgi:hypothetical protein